jgi:beta-lactamase regulating signal transducer with metallopeptidase domain
MARNENRRKKKLDAWRRKSTKKKREIAIRKSSGVTGLVVAAQGWPVIFPK